MGKKRAEGAGAKSARNGAVGQGAETIRPDRLRIAMIAPCPFPANHGTPGGIREKAEALVRLGHEVHIVTYASRQDSLEVRGVTIHRIPRIGPVDKIVIGPSFAKMYWDVLLTLKAISVIRRYKIDVIHGMNYEGALAGGIAKWITGRPLVYGAVNTMIDELPTYRFMPGWMAKILARFLDNYVPRLADRVVCYTATIRDFLVKAGVPNERIDITKLGIDLEMFREVCPDQAAEARKTMNAESDPLIVYTGVLNRFQRIDYLLKAMRVVLTEIPTAKLAFVRTLPDEAERKEVAEVAVQEGVDHCVVFPEVIRLGELPAYIAAADASAVPRPDCPGIPVKLINFMAAGKPVVVTKGSSQGLQDGREALVTADHDTKAMGQALLRILKDKGLADSLGEQARATAYVEYDRMHTTRDLVNTYRRVLGRAIVSHDPVDTHRGPAIMAEKSTGGRRAGSKSPVALHPMVVEPTISAAPKETLGS